MLLKVQLSTLQNAASHTQALFVVLSAMLPSCFLSIALLLFVFGPQGSLLYERISLCLTLYFKALCLCRLMRKRRDRTQTTTMQVKLAQCCFLTWVAQQQVKMFSICSKFFAFNIIDILSAH